MSAGDFLYFKVQPELPPPRILVERFLATRLLLEVFLRVLPFLLLCLLPPVIFLLRNIFEHLGRPEGVRRNSVHNPARTMLMQTEPGGAS